MHLCTETHIVGATTFSEEPVIDSYPYRQPDVFVDDGANIGSFAARFAERGWSVVAFEHRPPR
jgi:hypothetical protein